LPAQSADVEQTLGHFSYAGLRQRPDVLRSFSSKGTDMQQTSPLDVSHWALDVHAVGHLVAGAQMGVL
jgi:hypothetical protein